MKPQFLHPRIFAYLITLLFISGEAFSQGETLRANVHINNDIHGYYEYLPLSYYNEHPQGFKGYPVIIYQTGSGNTGDGSESSLSNRIMNIDINRYSPMLRLRESPNYPKSFTVNGQTFEYILICAQYTREPYYDLKTYKQCINDIIDYVLANYNADKDRIYLTGHSTGAGCMIDYLGESENNAKRIAAAALCTANIEITQDSANNIAKAKTPVWFAVSEFDFNGVFRDIAVNNANKILNATPSPPPFANPYVNIFHDDPTNHNRALFYTFDPTYKVNGLNIFEWLLQFDKQQALPVTGLQAVAKNTGTSVRVDWSTICEVNSASYTIEISNNGRDFKDIYTTVSQNSNIGANYSYTITRPFDGINYIRIKHLDKDGSPMLSNIVTVNFGNSSAIRVYPNPAKNVLNLEASQSAFKPGLVRIFNNNGKLLKEFTLKGVSRQQFDISSLPKGFYTGKIFDGKNISDFSFVKE